MPKIIILKVRIKVDQGASIFWMHGGLGVKQQKVLNLST